MCHRKRQSQVSRIDCFRICLDNNSFLETKLSYRFKFWIFVSTVIFFLICTYRIDLSFYTSQTLDVNIGLSLYPAHFENFPEVVQMFKNGGLNYSAIKPINLQYSKVEFSVSPNISNDLGILVIVKSARDNYQKRNIIRKTWGSPEYLRENYISPDMPTKVLFICGQSGKEYEQDYHYDLTSEIYYKDIIVAGFIDSYYNNTYKSLAAFKWALTELKGSFMYLALLDDDVYIDMVNLGSFLRELKYKRVKAETSYYSGYPYYTFNPRRDSNTLAVKDIDNGLYIGRIIADSIPDRKSRSKWFTSHDDYPYNAFPPYVPGAGMVLDYRAVSDMYYASHFVRHLWIDDVYLGILAAKLGLIPLDERNFYAPLKLDRNLKTNFITESILLHGFQCPAQILDFWNKREMKYLQEC